MPQQQTSSPEQGQQFDWWAAPVATSAVQGIEAVPSAPVRTEQLVPAQPAPVAAVVPAVLAVPAPTAQAADSTEVYRAVQRSEVFQEIRRSYRAFVFPASFAFLGWYLTYVAAQAAAPGLMRTPVAGPLNVAWLLSLLQFASTFLLTWLYARNARTKRDRAARGLRWDTQDQLR
ncbi:DUF485 domain-containing protein [Streptomyces kaniharaensis]|uniref:DUF485 domain-containing protein n=1 Tax=Streptomyces kaniharaensis TaxID=212423 RepID=UPI002DDD5D0D|nr:DUF485 domain-containing protein [Streptomyces kaniharaensis]